MLLGGCGIEGSDKQTIKDESELVTDMSQAHFISAPITQSSGDITDYEVSYEMLVEGTEACFVLGDDCGEYGKLVLCELSDNDESYFTIKQMNWGKPDPGSEPQAVQVARSEDHRYKVEFSVSGKELKASVNGQDVGTLSIPGNPLGAVGVYMRRGEDYAYIDNISVSNGDEKLFYDDFDGNFGNEVYPYDYANAPVSIFSPYHIDIKDIGGENMLRIKAGCLLTETKAEPAPMFRREFSLGGKKLESAHLFMTALGSYDVEINGEKINQDYFSPGKMSFDKKLNYVAYDITDAVSDNNTLDIYLFHGFYDRGLGYPEVASFWGHRLAIRGVLELTYKGGEKEIITTDENFKVCTDTRYRFSDIYQGEIIDDRYGKNMTFEDVVVDDVDQIYMDAVSQKKLNDTITSPMKLDAAYVGPVGEGRYVYDFGQNCAGTVEISAEALKDAGYEKGDVLTFRYGELLNSEKLVNSDDVEGSVWTRNLLSAKATDYYVFGDDSNVRISFDHTYHGFRYMEIDGAKVPIDEKGIKLVVLSSVNRDTASFECSDDVINRFYENSIWSMRSNMLDNPTDCPQRDERLGWSGDAQITSGFGTYQFDSRTFYENYVEEMVGQQSEDGKFSDIAPMCDAIGGHSCWGDAPVAIAWDLYLQYDDKKIIEENLDAFCKWIDYLESISEDYICVSDGYGDHLALQGTPHALTDTAWCAYSAGLVSKMALVLGQKDKAQKYGEISNRFKEAWRTEFMSESPSVETGLLKAEAESETAYALGVYFEMFPEEYIDAAAERLKLLSEYGGYGFYPGYSGMRFYLPVLFDHGYGDTAIRVMRNTEIGGLCSGLTSDMTTNTESLNCIKYIDQDGNAYGDDRFYASASLNHAAFASVAWSLYRDILGIRPDENAPGYSHFFIKPCISEELEHASGQYECNYGVIEVSWNGSEHKINCVLPKGTAATLTLPTGEDVEVTDGSHEFTW